MNRSIPLALVTVVSWFGCGGAPAPEQTTSSTTTAPAEAPTEEEEEKAPTSGTVDDEAAGPTVVAQENSSLEVPATTLDKESIRRVIRAELPEIRKCYEAGLMRKPELNGTVTASFLIDAAGAVPSSSASGLGDAQVESCIASLLRRVRFPAEANRGPVIVNYPFNLRPTTD